MTPGFRFHVARPPVLLGDDELHQITGGYVRSLQQLGGEIETKENSLDSEPLFVLVATGGTEEVVLDLCRERRVAEPHEPVFLIAHPSNNSLPAALEILARLQQDGRPGRIFFLEGADDTAGMDRIADTAHDVLTHRAFQRLRIGLVGNPSDWLVASSPVPTILTSTWGPAVVPVEMTEIETAMDRISSDSIVPMVESLTARAHEVREPSRADRENVVRVYEALRAVVDRHQLDALTVRCFDLVLHQRTTGCFALARLNDDGVIAGCEGDLVSTMGMLWAHRLLGETPWMANPASLDEVENTLWLAHCTVPESLVDSYTLRSHFESGMGVAIQGNLRSQPVTLLRIGGPDMTKLWVAEGEILRNGTSEALCRTQVKIRLDQGRVSDLLSSPLGNHLVMVGGTHADRFQRWHAMYVSKPRD